MIILRQKYFSSTWRNIKDPTERSKKAKELLEARKEINTRKEALNNQRLQDLRSAALGELKDKSGKHLSYKDVEGKFKAQMEDLSKYQEAITDNNKKGRGIATKKVAEQEAKKVASEKLKKNLKTGGKIALGTVAAAGLAYGGKKAYDKYKSKEKENEVRKRFGDNKK